ncbi:hypothetical protein [Tessaracoccus coleopterorum]|nr:hypothetical protein [Tessaracoccus coleopterorum]
MLLQYDTSKWAAYERPLTEADPHRSGPAKVDGKYFAFTGNTHYGVQNLEYDPYLQRWWMGVYRGTKTQYPNYLMYAVDAKDKPRMQTLTGLDGEKGLLLPLAQDGLLDEATGIRGWQQDASVGIQSLDNGLYYLATQTKVDGKQASVINLETWNGDAADPFVPVTSDFEYPGSPEPSTRPARRPGSPDRTGAPRGGRRTSAPATSTARGSRSSPPRTARPCGPRRGSSPQVTSSSMTATPSPPSGGPVTRNRATRPAPGSGPEHNQPPAPGTPGQAPKRKARDGPDPARTTHRIPRRVPVRPGRDDLPG